MSPHDRASLAQVAAYPRDAEIARLKLFCRMFREDRDSITAQWDRRGEFIHKLRTEMEAGSAELESARNAIAFLRESLAVLRDENAELRAALALARRENSA